MSERDYWDTKFARMEDELIKRAERLAIAIEALQFYASGVYGYGPSEVLIDQGQKARDALEAINTK